MEYIEFFKTLHIEVEKEIDKNCIDDDLEKILCENGYQIIGGIGHTDIIHKDKRDPKNCHKAWLQHYDKIKNAW